MTNVHRGTFIGSLLLVATTLVVTPALAQVELSGEWASRNHEDYWDRLAGLYIGDYSGLPINRAGRLKAESWQESVLAEPERQCIPHVATYFSRGGTGVFRISKVVDPATRQVLAWEMGPFHHTFRMIWMDGRPHPPEYAAHTWGGFSTGKWDGNTLTVTTTHIKIGWIQRNGVPTSDRATMVEHFYRHDNYLTMVTIVTDPAFLEEPFIRTTDWVLTPGMNVPGIYPCGPDQSTAEATGWARGHVPHYLPGTNDQLSEFAASRGIPLEGVLGGAETTYPEYRLKLKKLMNERSSPSATATASAADPVIGSWLLNRGKSTFSNLPVPERRIMKYEAVGDAIRYVIDTQPMTNDSGYDRVEYTAKYDGKDYPITGSVLNTVSLKRVDANTIERTGKVGAEVVETATTTISPDGKMLTITSKGTTRIRNGARTYSSVQVFERQ